MKIKLFLIICFLFFRVLNFAQMMDDIRKSVQQSPKFSFRFDNRNSFISNSRAQITGIKLGIEFDDKFRVGGGFHELKSELTKSKDILDTTVTSFLKLNYTHLHLLLLLNYIPSHLIVLFRNYKHLLH